MDAFKLAIAATAVTNTQWGPRDADGRRREFSAAELDALVDFGWPWADVKSHLGAGAHAMLSRVRPRASNRLKPTRLPSAEATAQV